MTNLKLIIGLTLILSVCVPLSNACAATYYVRTDGGTATQCTGLADAKYSGSGNGQACAFNHPVWALGATGTTKKLNGGDTLIIDNVDHANNGQAQYKIGWGMPNTISANCALSWSYSCFMNNVPGGPDPAHPTRIVGKGYETGCSGNKAQLWGTDGVRQIFDVSGASHVDIECLELTDHSNCGFRVGSPLCAENWNSGTSSGGWAARGVFGHTGADLIFRNLDVHGFGDRAFLMGGINGLIFSYVNMDGNYMSNWDSDVGHNNNESYNSGTIVLDHVNNRFAGCSEKYPRSATFNTADYSNCTDQGDNPPGYGDGYGGYTTGGDWIVTNSEFSHNTSDGLDLLYHDGTGSISVRRSLFEGNVGNQLKVTSPSINVEDSILIGNCTYLRDSGKVKNTSSFTTCRAGGDVVAMTPAGGGTYKFLNSTFYSNATSMVLLVNRLGTCNGSEKYTFRNNIYVGNGTTSGLYVNTLEGSCATPALDTDYSITKNIYGNFCPGGSHNKCNTDPKWVGSINQAASTNVPNIYLQSSSPAIGAGTIITGLSSLDFSNFNRGSPWDIGALEYGSVPQGQTTCANAAQFCTTQADCILQGYYWYNNTCNPTAQALTCANGVQYCATQSECTGRGYFWFDNDCHTNPPTCADDIIYCTTQVLCTIQGYFWYNSACHPSAQGNTSPTVSLTAPANNTVLSPAPAVVNLSATAADTDGSIAKVEFFNGAARLNYSGTTPPYNYAWKNVQAGTYTLTAVATDNGGAVMTSTPVTITVNPKAVNLPPTISLITPGDNMVFAPAPAVVTLAANVSDPDGSIAKVEFFNGAAQLSYAGTTPPYTYNWKNVQAGTYTLTAVATDNTGAVTSSAPVTITVNAQVPNLPLAVHLTSPGSNMVFSSAPAVVTLSASVTDPDSSVATVEFYNGNARLSYSGTTPPYTYNWKNVQAGTYSLTAHVTDKDGMLTTSAPVMITVRP